MKKSFIIFLSIIFCVSCLLPVPVYSAAKKTAKKVKYAKKTKKKLKKKTAVKKVPMKKALPTPALTKLSSNETIAKPVGYSVDQVILKLKENQGKIQDMSADMSMALSTIVTMPGANTSSAMTAEQKGRLLLKDNDKLKMIISSPNKAETTLNGSKILQVMPGSGNRVVKIRNPGDPAYGGPNETQTLNINWDNINESYYLMLTQRGSETAISATPRLDNQTIGEVKYIVDPSRWVVTRFFEYDPDGKQLLQSDIEYVNLNETWVPAVVSTSANVMLTRIDSTMTLTNVQINQGLSDDEFVINE